MNKLQELLKKRKKEIKEEEMTKREYEEFRIKSNTERKNENFTVFAAPVSLGLLLGGGLGFVIAILKRIALWADHQDTSLYQPATPIIKWAMIGAALGLLLGLFIRLTKD